MREVRQLGDESLRKTTFKLDGNFMTGGSAFALLDDAVAKRRMGDVHAFLIALRHTVFGSALVEVVIEVIIGIVTRDP